MNRSVENNVHKRSKCEDEDEKMVQTPRPAGSLQCIAGTGENTTDGAVCVAGDDGHNSSLEVNVLARGEKRTSQSK